MRHSLICPLHASPASAPLSPPSQSSLNKGHTLTKIHLLFFPIWYCLHSGSWKSQTYSHNLVQKLFPSLNSSLTSQHWETYYTLNLFVCLYSQNDIVSRRRDYMFIHFSSSNLLCISALKYFWLRITEWLNEHAKINRLTEKKNKLINKRMLQMSAREVLLGSTHFCWE